jgi:tetratricopeptide (TPR) repeat protein
VREARAAFTRALALDPERVEALVYLARIASLEGRPRAADSLLTLARTTSPDTRALAVRAVRSLVGGDGVTPVGALRSLANGRDLDAQDAALRMAVAGDDPRAARGLALSLLRAAPSRELRGLALRLMAVSAASSGQWEAATRALDQLALGEPDAAVRLRASLAAVPILSRATARDRRTLSRTLAEAPRAPSASSMAPLDWWRVGLLAEVSGDASTLAHAAGRVRALTHVERAARAQSLAAGLEARAARLAGDPREALRVLDAARLPARGAFDPVVHETETADRFLRAELLHALGRDAEAVGWYASIAEGATSELPWLAPAQLRLGELAAARGDRTAALRHYRRVLAFWERCDPALQPITRTVQARVVELERAGAPVGASSVPGSRALAR